MARTLVDIIKRMRHDGCGGLAGKGRAHDRHRGRQQQTRATDRAAGLTRALHDHGSEELVPSYPGFFGLIECDRCGKAKMQLSLDARFPDAPPGQAV